MQGFWNLIGKSGEGPGKDFQYDVGEKASTSFDTKSVWTLYHGKKRGTGDIVSIFICDGKVSTPDELFLAKTGHKRLKTLRHPNIIKYLDGFESETLVYVVTEPVVPLLDFLDEEDGRNSNLLAWGMYQVISGLSFLINNGNMIHENVNIFSIFVGVDGEWKLGGVEYVHSNDSDVVAKLPYLCRYDAPEGANKKRGEIWSTDAWGLGCLIWEIYNGVLTTSADLKSVSKIPKPLLLHYCDLVHANPKKRTNPKTFLARCLEPGHFFDNQFIKANLFLNEIQIQDANQQKEFFIALDKSLDTFPKQFCIHKVLPQLLNAFEYGSAGSAVLSPLFKVGLLLDPEAYQVKITPCIIKLFSSNDRATRIQLLQQMEKFVKHLQPSVVDSQIFGCVATGFGDTLPAMREQTVKAMLHLVPKLSPKTISNQLLRFFAKLQMDEQPGIRTNTTVCLGKIAEYIPEDTRKKVLAPGFVRAIHDPFPHARNAGIMAMAATQKYYTSADIANRLIPALSVLTVDPEKSVRDNAFKVIRSFLSALESNSNDPANAVNMNPDTTPEQNSSTWTGWAVTSLTSRFYQTPGDSASTGSPVAPAKSAAGSTSVETQQTSPKSATANDKNSYAVVESTDVDNVKKEAIVDLSDVKNDLTAIKKDLEEFSQSVGDTTGYESDKSDYGDWGGNNDWGDEKQMDNDDGWGTTNTNNSGDVWGSFDTAKPLESTKVKPSSSTNKMSAAEKFVVKPFPDDSPKLASSLFGNSQTESDFDKINPNTDTQNTDMATESGWDTNTNDGWGSNVDQGWDTNTNITDGWDDNNVNQENDEEKQKELAKEKRKQEMQRKREEQKLKREQKRAAGGGAMKLGTLKKSGLGSG